MTYKNYQKKADKRDTKLILLTRDRVLPNDFFIAAEDNYRTDKEVIDVLKGSTIL